MKLNNVSASQVKTFRSCKRKWHWNKVSKLRSPSTASQKRGTAIHHALELYLANGTVAGGVEIGADGNATGTVTNSKPKEGPRDNGTQWFETARFVNAAKKYLPKPRNQTLASGEGSEFMLEAPMRLPTLSGSGPLWFGYIDLLIELWEHDRIDAEMPCVTDYKTTSSIRSYSMTPQELEDDIQANSYAWYCFKNLPSLQEVAVRWLYLETRNKIKVNTKEVIAVLSRDKVEAEWKRAGQDIEEMMLLALESDSLKIEPNTEACGDYGGCEYRNNCGMSVLQDSFSSAISKTSKKQEKAAMGFLQKIKKSNGKKSQTETSEEEGVLSSDAADRTTSDEEAEELTTPKSKKKASKKTAKKTTKKAPKKEESAEQTEEQKPPAKKSPGRPKGAKNKNTGFRLFVNTVGVKTARPFMMFEDWFAPILESLNEQCAEAMGKPDYWLLAFGEQKAALKTAVREAAKDLDVDLFVTSSNPYVKDAMQELVPCAVEVFKGTV